MPAFANTQLKRKENFKAKVMSQSMDIHLTQIRSQITNQKTNIAKVQPEASKKKVKRRFQPRQSSESSSSGNQGSQDRVTESDFMTIYKKRRARVKKSMTVAPHLHNLAPAYRKPKKKSTLYKHQMTFKRKGPLITGKTARVTDKSVEDVNKLSIPNAVIFEEVSESSAYHSPKSKRLKLIDGPHQPKFMSSGLTVITENEKVGSQQAEQQTTHLQSFKNSSEALNDSYCKMALRKGQTVSMSPGKACGTSSAR